MSKLSPADMPGSMAILGLLKETPDMTVAEVGEALGERFAVCRFDASTARQALLRMEKDRDGHPPRVLCTYRPPGRSRMQDRYRVASTGVEDFDGWMFMKPVGTPALREALYGRIELCRLEDLPELIRLAREERDLATDLYSQTKEQLKKHLEEERMRPWARRDLGPEDYVRKVRNVLKHVTPEYWSSRSLHFDEIAEQLEGIAEEAGLDFPPRQ